MSSSNRNRARSNQSRPAHNRPSAAPKQAVDKQPSTAERAAKLGAKVPTDNKAVEAPEVDYHKHPEKLEWWSELIDPVEIDSFEDEHLLDYRVTLVMGSYMKLHIEAFDSEGNPVEVFDKDEVFVNPVNESGEEIDIFDSEGNPIDLTQKLDELKQDLVNRDPEEELRNISRLMDLMCQKFAKDTNRLRALVKGDKEGIQKMVLLSSVYAAKLGESGRSES